MPREAELEASKLRLANESATTVLCRATYKGNRDQFERAECRH